MKKNKFKILLIIISIWFSLSACVDKESDATISENTYESLREYNIDVREELHNDELNLLAVSLEKYLLDNYPAGTFLLIQDKITTGIKNKPAILIHPYDDNYFFAVIANSKAGERFIETKNITGFYSSFVNQDSTKLGTAFMKLVLFKKFDENIERVWSTDVPSHGGFEALAFSNYNEMNLNYIEVICMDGISRGNRKYNYFLVNGLTNKPQLLETRKSLRYDKVVADLNNDSFPDYRSLYLRQSSKGFEVNASIAFIWNTKLQKYVSRSDKNIFTHY